MDEKKSLEANLISIPGMSRKTALAVCQGVGFSPRSLWNSLEPAQKRRLQEWMQDFFSKEGRLVGVDYRRARQKGKESLIQMGSFRGIRLRLGLPVRGQRTKTNARTCRRRF